ncbi:FRIGIDA-like protein 3 [Chenopodium quinoa]|uniref:FRIGIDA-like protein 3 n=1 Tax=Chenopodium quinoa TaxID=63459 RepID=UPI000B775E94|nr:FRIGIDA-like protein 3 [Chenopodium quinoa]
MENLHPHATSISPLSEQWRSLQSSFSLIKTSMADRVKVIESKEREILQAAKTLENSLKEVELLENSINQRLKEVQIREEQLSEKIDAFEVKVTKIDEISKELDVKRCEMEEMKATIMEEKKVMEGEIEERRKVVEERENEMDERCRVLDCREKVLNKRSQDLVMKFKEFDERRKVLEMEERELREGLLELKAKQSKELTTYQAKTRELQPVACSEIQLLCRNMNTNGMISYLIKHYKDIHMMLSKISDSLQLAPDPAKLVLNVIQSFYELVKSENMTRQVYLASCIALSGALMKLNTSITLHIKDDAMKFSIMWRDFSAKQSYTQSQLMEIFAFLQFLASYKLAQSYDEDELFSLLGNFYTESEVRWPEKDSYLCRILGLKKKIPGMLNLYLCPQSEN